MIGVIKAVLSEHLSDWNGMRYVLIDVNTGEVADDGQGRGYCSAEAAYKAYGWKHRDRSKDRERLEKQKMILAWMKDHREFIRLLNEAGRKEKLKAAGLRRILKENGLQDVPFHAGDFLKVWNRL
jgi:hypothetical protein